ncbi:hypothetical protein Btru_054268 [Bulinus truncatus]|nr:hypothetical protein Btru_054268 [Bulinus truncatus]
MELMANSVLRKICDAIRSAQALAVIIDGTTDVSTVEQDVESFIGFYAASNGTSGQAMADLIFDALLRLNLPINQLRGQAFDGAVNMSGNLAAHEAMETSLVIHDAANLTHEIAAFCQKSTKLAGILSALQATNNEHVRIRPPCHTRVLNRGPALKIML